jgi:hypothetical protein
MAAENHGDMALTGEAEELGEKSVPVPLSPPLIPHGLTQVRSRVSAVRSYGAARTFFYYEALRYAAFFVLLS